jgi:hypothetical protein
MREALLDMSFFHIRDEDIHPGETSGCNVARCPDFSGKLEDLEEVFHHFTRKLPFLMGLEERKDFTKTERAIVEAMDKRRAAWERIFKAPNRYILQSAFGFGPWSVMDRKRQEWGTDANSLFLYLVRRRQAMEGTKLIEV